LLYYTDWVIIDPICTFLFSILVVFTTVPIAKDCLNVLANETPLNFDVEEYIASLKEIISIKEVRSVKIWSINLD